MSEFVKNIPFAEPVSLTGLIDVEPGKVISRTFVQRPEVSITLFSFGAGDDINRLGGIGRLEVVPPRARHDDFALARSRPRCIFSLILREGDNGRRRGQNGDNRATRAKQFSHGPLPFAKALGFATELSSRPWHDQK